MRQKPPSKQERVKVNRRWGLRRALVNSLCLGWLLSSVVTGIDWYANGFDHANQRLMAMRHQAWQMDAPYRHTRWVKWWRAGKQGVAQVVKQSLHAAWLTNSVRMGEGLLHQARLLPLIVKIKTVVGKGMQSMSKGGRLLKNNTLMIGDKLLLFILALPMLLVSSILGVIDGLARREIREAEWGRESSFIFHRIIVAIPWLFFFGMTAYFVLPFWIPPTLFFIGVSAMTLGLLSQVVSQFKKQL